MQHTFFDCIIKSFILLFLSTFYYHQVKSSQVKSIPFSFFVFIFYTTYIFLLNHKVYYYPISLYYHQVKSITLLFLLTFSFLFCMQHTFFYCIIKSISLLFTIIKSSQVKSSQVKSILCYFFFLFIFYATYIFLLHHKV